MRNSLFPSIVIEWNKIDNDLGKSESVSAFKNEILIFVRSSPNSTFNVHNPHGIKLLTILRVGLSHLHELKFRYNFQDSLDPFCNCGRLIETTIDFFLHYSNYSNRRKSLFEKISNIKRSSLSQNNSIIVETLLFWSNGHNDEENAWIIESTTEYIITTESFLKPLSWIHWSKLSLYLKSLIDSGSSYVIPFSCLEVQLLYIYIYIYIYIQNDIKPINLTIKDNYSIGVLWQAIFVLIFFYGYNIHNKKKEKY